MMLVYHAYRPFLVFGRLHIAVNCELSLKFKLTSIEEE